MPYVSLILSLIVLSFSIKACFFTKKSTRTCVRWLTTSAIAWVVLAAFDALAVTPPSMVNVMISGFNAIIMAVTANIESKLVIEEDTRGKD